jgi:hypothetical protein
MDIRRNAHPTLEEFTARAEICHQRWIVYDEMDTRPVWRVSPNWAFELVVAEENGRMEGVCFVLPSGGELDGERLDWVYCFQLATRIEAGKHRRHADVAHHGPVSGHPEHGRHRCGEACTIVLRLEAYDKVWRGVHRLPWNA